MLDSVTFSQAVLCVGAQDGRSSPACSRNSEEAVEQAESTWKTSWRRWHKQSPSSEAEGLGENPGWVRVQGWGLRLHPLLVLQLLGAHKRASASWGLQEGMPESLVPGDLCVPLCLWGGGPGVFVLSPHTLSAAANLFCLPASPRLPLCPGRPLPGDPVGTSTGDMLGASPPIAQAWSSWSSGGTGHRAHRDRLASPILSLSLASNRPVSLRGPTPLACVVSLDWTI